MLLNCNELFNNNIIYLISLELDKECGIIPFVGVLAQLIERCIRIAEVAGLSPAYSTKKSLFELFELFE